MLPSFGFVLGYDGAPSRGLLPLGLGLVAGWGFGLRGESDEQEDEDDGDSLVELITSGFVEDGLSGVVMLLRCVR